MSTTRTIEPTQITIGERIEWERSFADISAADYDLQFRFRSNVGPGFDVNAAADGDVFIAEITAVQSALMKPGLYRYQAWLTEIATPTHTFVVAEGQITAIAGFAAGDTGDVETRSAAKIAYDNITAALAGVATNDQLEYEISVGQASRRVKRIPRTELLELKKHFAAIVANENAAERVRNGQPLMNSIHMRLRDE